ncbi:pentapeptide repeat-containing protein [Nocardia vinacea]|uniref:Pentapeptide repeat-containing protein n=1 Tax=Nocardia vinacea TaxID=96468 RepID=A0ABZ1YLL6_9NOCA|nr:pentapeptide repeat-containing protein [Nocardia vinacea]
MTPQRRPHFIPREDGPAPVWWFRDLIIALVIGLLITVSGIAVQRHFDQQREGRERAFATQQHLQSLRLANLTFVRDSSSNEPQVRRPFNRMDLQGQNLNGLQLDGADLMEANLIGANMLVANLAGADLTHADLTGVDLTRANLPHADLPHANLTHADLTDANLTDADLTGANLTDANLRGAYLTGANLAGADLTHADLTGVDLSVICRYWNSPPLVPDGVRLPDSQILRPCKQRG